MLRRCAVRVISQKWAPCSAQVQSLVADSQQDPTGKTLQNARNFLRDVDTTRVICEPDDILELVYFMQRVQYPKSSKLETAAREWLEAHASEFEPKHLRVVCRYVVECAKRGASSAAAAAGGTSSTAQWASTRRAPHIAAVDVWRTVVLRTAWFRNRFAEMVRTMDHDDILLVAKVLTWARDAPSKVGASSASAGDGAASQPSIAVDDTGILSVALQQRCKELLLASVQPQKKKHNGEWLLRSGASALRRDALVDLMTYVTPYDTTNELASLMKPHVAALTAEEATQLVGAMSGRCAAHQLGLLQELVAQFLPSVDRSACDSASATRLGTQICMSALAVSVDGGSTAPTALRSAVQQLCSQLVERWSRDGGTDEDGIKLLADVLSMLERQVGAPLPESDALLRAAACTVAPTLQLLLSATLHRNTEWKAVWAALAKGGAADASQKREGQASGTLLGGVSLEGSMHIIRALSILLLREDGLTTAASRSRAPEVLSAEHLQQTRAVVAMCSARMLSDAVSLSIRDVAALLYVTVLVADAAQQHLAVDSALSAQSELTDRLVQRLVHSSKFTSSSSSGGGGSAALMASGRGASSSPSVGTGWSLSVARMVVLALALAEYNTPRHPALVDILNQVFEDALQRFGQHKSSVPLGLGQCASLLVALSDAQLQGAPATRSVLQLALAATPAANGAALVQALTVISVLNIRDIHIACTLLREMERCQDVTPQMLVQAGDAARRLRLTQQFQTSKLSQRVTSLSLHHPVSAPPALHAIADPMSLEQFAILLSVCVVDEQRRLFALAQRTTVSSSAPQPGTSTLLAQYSNGLEAYLGRHHAVALMLLACKECPPSIASGVTAFLSTAAPLPPDEADPMALVAAVAVIDDAVLDRKRTLSGAANHPKAATGTTSTGAVTPSVEATTVFAHLMTFGIHSVLKLDEPSLAQLVGTAMALDTVPNSVFRAIGRRIGVLADGMTPENAIKCLELYAKYKVRDDRVVKALLHRCVFTMGMIGGSVDLSARLRRVIEAYPHWSSTASQALQRYGAIKARRERRAV